MRKTAVAGAGFIALAALAPLQAQPDAPVDLPAIQVTAGRTAEPGFEVPQPVTTVSREQIQRITPRTVADLLRGATGVALQSSGPGQGTVIVRGLKGSEVLHLVDGMRLNNAFFRNSPNQYVALVDAYNVSRIEVLRGPASTLYGSDALGGVVQFLTPEHRFGGAQWGLRGGALTQFGSADLSKTGRGWLAGGNENISLAGGVTHLDAGGIRTGDADRLPESQTGYRARGYDGKVLLTPTPGHEVMLSAQFFEYPRLPRYHEISVQPNSVANNPGGLPQRTEALFQPNDRRFAHLRYRFAAALGPIRAFEFHAARQVIDDDRSVIPQRPDQPAQRREFEENRSTLDGFTTQLEGQLGPAQIRLGGEYYRDRVDSAKRCRPLDGGTSCASPAATTPVFPDGSKQSSAGLYVSGELPLSAAWLLDAGLRYNAVRTDLAATVRSDAAKIDHDDVTGNLGFSMRVTPSLRWTGNVAHGFRAPNIFDLGTLGPRSGSNEINVPNPDLDSETLDSVDTGFKWQRGGLYSELVVFHTRYRDRIEPREPTGNTIAAGDLGCTDAAGCPEVRSENISEAVYWGWEAGGSWRLAAGAELYASLNLTRGTERRADGSETPANRVPPVSGRAGGLWRLAQFSIEPFVLFAGEQRRLDEDDEGDIRIAPGGTAGWATLNARFGWNPAPQLRVQVEGVNLLDRRYREHGSGIEGHGRSGTLTAEFLF